MQTWKVYGLYDPRDEKLRYVGCTSMPLLSSRLAMHVNTARLPTQKGHLTPRAVWMREVLDAGFRPKAVLLQSCFSKEEALEVEQEWIRRFENELTNFTGKRKRFKPVSPEERLNRSRSSKRRAEEAAQSKDRTRDKNGKLTIFGAQILAAEARRKKS